MLGVSFGSMLIPLQFPFSCECHEYNKVTDVIEYVRRSTLNMTNLNAAHKRKGRSTLYHIVQNDFAMTVTTKWKLGFRVIFRHGIRSQEITGIV